MAYISRSDLNVRNSFLLTIFFVCLFVALAVFPTIVIIVLIALCLWALTGPAQALEALSLSVIIKFLNPAIFSFSANTTILFFIVMFLASARILTTITVKHIKLIFPLLMFFLTVVGLSLASSPSIEVSIMKAVLFTTLVSAVLVACYRQSVRIVERWKFWFLSLSIAVILLSLATLAEPNIAYFRNGRGFQGLFNHPQVLGPWAAAHACWMLFAILEDDKNNVSNMTYKLLSLGLLIAIIIASKARTGMVSFLLSITTTYIVIVFSKRNSKISVGKSTAIALVTFILLSGAFVYIDPAREIANDYIQKGGEQNAAEAFTHSRGSAALQQWNNFLKKPLTGNGFGVYANGYFPGGIKRVYGIPVSASVEKGFLPTAIFEEIGLIGVIVFAFFFITIILQIIKGSEPRWIAMFFACVYLNAGEAVLFSVGGIGLYYWCLMGLCLAVSTENVPARKQGTSKLEEYIS